MEKKNINDVSLYIFIRGILDTKYYVVFLSLFFLIITYFILNTNRTDNYTLALEINDKIDLSYSQKINSIVLTNQEVIDLSTIREKSIYQNTEVVRRYLNDIQETSLINISNNKIVNMIYLELKRKINQQNMKIDNLNLNVQNTSSFEKQNKKEIKLTISFDVPDINKFEKDLIDIDFVVKDKLKKEVDTLISNFEYLKNIKLDKINEKLKERTLKAQYFREAKINSLTQKVKIADSLGIIEPSKVDSLNDVSELNERIYDTDIYPTILNQLIDPKNVVFRDLLDSLSEIIFKGSKGLSSEIIEIKKLSLDQFLYREGMFKDFDLFMEIAQNVEVLKSNDAVEKIKKIRDELGFERNDDLLVKIIEDSIVNNKPTFNDQFRIYIISFFLSIIIGIIIGFIFNRVINEAKIYKSKFNN